MRILIDMQACQSESRFRGIGRYSFLFVEALLQLELDHEYHFLLNGYFVDSIPTLRSSFKKWVPKSQTHVFFPVGQVSHFDENNESRRQFSQLLRESIIESVCPDVLLLTSVVEGFKDNALIDIPRSRRYHVAAVLYDLIPLVMSDVYLTDRGYAKFYREKLDLLRNCDSLLAISHHSAKEAKDHLGIDPERMSIIGAGNGFDAHTISSPAPETTLSELGITKPFVLYAPGGYDPRKNVSRLVQAWMKLPLNLRQKYQLVFGSRIADRSQVEKPTRRYNLKKGDYIITDYVDDRVLARLYRSCDLFVFPSLHEGFGLPVLEAMSCGAPVIASNCSSIPEVLGYEESEFDPMDVDSIHEKLLRGLTDGLFRDQLREAGKRQVERFVWKNCAIGAKEHFANKCKTSGETSWSRDPKGSSLETAMESLDQNRGAFSGSDLVGICVSAAQLVRRDGPPQLFVDVSALVEHDAKTGIQRVVRSILEYLPRKLQSTHQVVPVYGDSTGRFRVAQKWSTGHASQDLAIDPRLGDFFLGLDLSAHLFPVYTPEIARLRAIGVDVAFVVYDLIPLILPEFCDEGMVRAFDLWMNAIVRNADRLICISRSVQEELEDWIAENVPESVPRPLLDWFHLGADIQASKPTVGLPPEAESILAELTLRPSYLMVGTVEPRKGHRFVLEAFDLLWSRNRDANLVIVGKLGWKMEALATVLTSHNQYGKRLFWLPGISDEFLDHIYQRARALIAASEAEGFGLPIIEAAQKQLPVIVRDIPVFREVAGHGGMYFSGSDPRFLTETIENDLELQNGQRMIEGKNIIHWRTWEQSTDQLIDKLQLR